MVSCNCSRVEEMSHSCRADDLRSEKVGCRLNPTEIRLFHKNIIEMKRFDIWKNRLKKDKTIIVPSNGDLETKLGRNSNFQPSSTRKPRGSTKLQVGVDTSASSHLRGSVRGPGGFNGGPGMKISPLGTRIIPV